MEFSTYEFIALLSAVVIFIMGICLMVVSVPKEPELKNYRVSRYFLAVAYVSLTILHFLGIFFDSQIHEERIITAIQAMLVTFALITLINRRFVTLKRLFYQLLLISLLSGLILCNTYLFPSQSRLLSQMSCVGYFGLYLYYVYLFFKEYRNYKRRTDNFYAGNEYKRLQWVMQTFIMVAVVGILGGLSKGNDVFFLVFIGCYTVVYVYLAIRYINYGHIFHRVAPVVVLADEEEEEEEGVDQVIWKKQMCQSIDVWIEERGFLTDDVSLDTLSKKLGVNQSYLSRHINSMYEQNFRSWINGLRINEAQRLLAYREDLSIGEICEAVGIGSMSSFYRQFSTITQMTPQEYRSQFQNNREAK